MSACRRWNEKDDLYRTSRLILPQRTVSTSNSGYHAANSAVAKTEDEMVEGTIGDLENLATETATEHGVVVALTEANARLARQLEERSKEVKEFKALLKKERTWRRFFTHSLVNYFWSRGYKVAKSHTSQNCKYPKDGHKKEATKDNNMGGSRANK
jgi:hypothetical protein